MRIPVTTANDSTPASPVWSIKPSNSFFSQWSPFCRSEDLREAQKTIADLQRQLNFADLWIEWFRENQSMRFEPLINCNISETSPSKHFKITAITCEFFSSEGTTDKSNPPNPEFLRNRNSHEKRMQEDRRILEESETIQKIVEETLKKAEEYPLPFVEPILSAIRGLITWIRSFFIKG